MLTIGVGGAHMRGFPVEVDGRRLVVVLRADRDGLVTIVPPRPQGFQQGWEPSVARLVAEQMLAAEAFLAAGRVV